jgi:nitroreductase
LDLDAVLRRRRMVRSFLPDPVPDATLDRVLAAALRAPSAGNTQATELVVLRGPVETARYWDVTLPAARRDGFVWPGLLTAPVLIVPFTSRQAYLDRYGEPDKARTGLESAARWLVPYWYVDAGFTAMLMQLVAIDEGLGTLFFGIFDHAAALCAVLDVPPAFEPIGTLAVGYADPSGDRPGRSAVRPRRGIDEIVHRGGW